MTASTRAEKTVIPARTRPWRVFGFVLLFLAGVAGVHAAWGWNNHRLLEKRIEAVRSTGQRVNIWDFPRPIGAVNPTPNGARDLTAAAKIIDDDTIHASSVSFVPTTMPVSEKAWPYLSDARDWFEPALRRIDLAQSRTRCDFPHNWH